MRPLTGIGLGIALAIVLGVATAGFAEDPAAAPEPTPDSVVGTLPFVPGYPTRVMVDLADEDSRDFVMMLDTGAAGSVITPGMARSLGVSVRRHKSSPYRRGTVLGRDIHFWVDTTSSDTASKTGWEYGLLGADFLDDYVVEIDYPSQRVRFLDPKKYRVPESTSAPDERVIPFRRAGTRALVDVEIDGRTTPVLLDTGAPDSLVLSGRAARKLGVDLTSLRDFGEVGTVMGPMQVLLLETDGFRFAGFEFDEMPALVAPKGWYNQAGPNDSVVGYDVLRQFVIRIDYKRKRIWLRRSGDPRITFQGADYAASRQIGAFLTPLGRGRYWAWGIAPDGAAARIGLREGDVVQAALGDEALDQDEILARIRAGQELTVARKQGDVWIDQVLSAPEAAASGPDDGG